MWRLLSSADTRQDRPHCTLHRSSASSGQQPLLRIPTIPDPGKMSHNTIFDVDAPSSNNLAFQGPSLLLAHALQSARAASQAAAPTRANKR